MVQSWQINRWRRGGSMLILAKELQTAKNIVVELKKLVHNIHGLRS